MCEWECTKVECLSKDVIRQARKSISIPGAFRKIAIAIRKDIRARRKHKMDTRDLLLKLYLWAVIEDFFHRVEWGTICDEHILHSTAEQFVKAIEAPYRTVIRANPKEDGHKVAS